LLSKTELSRLQQQITEYDKTREKLLDLTRKITRLAGWAIIQIHRRQIAKAKATLREAEGLVSETSSLLRTRFEFRQVGYVIVAFQELAEARILLGFVTRKKLLSQREVAAEWIPYLLGLLDFIGELRRMTMDRLKVGDLEGAEQAFGSMEAIHEDLLSLDRASIIPNFRRKMDTARRLVEATRADVVGEARRVSLENAMKNLEKRLR